MKIELKIANNISKLAGFDILKKTRTRQHIEARSLLFHILTKYYDKRPYYLSSTIKVGKKPLTNATILHSIKNFDIYRKYNKDLDKWLDAITIDQKSDSPSDLKRNYIKSKIDYLLDQDVNILADQVRDMFEEALIQQDKLEKELDKLDTDEG